MRTFRVGHVVAVVLCCAHALAQPPRPEFLVWQGTAPTEPDPHAPGSSPLLSCPSFPELKRFTLINAYNWFDVGGDHWMYAVDAANEAADDVLYRLTADPSTGARIDADEVTISISWFGADHAATPRR